MPPVLGKETHMRQYRPLPGSSRARRIAAFAVLVVVAISVSACKAKDRAITEIASEPVSTGTVQAQLPVDPNTIAIPNVETTFPASVTPTATGVGAGTDPTGVTESFAEAIAPDPAKPGSWWPKRVGRFADNFKPPTWYPRWLPKGYKFESLDLVEFDAGQSGLACDIVFLNGDKVLQFTQGSPKNRDYEIVSVKTVKWGDSTAYVMHQDPADTSTPIMIVMNQDGNLCELQGDASQAVLEKVAASMEVIE